jgi:hypothetical protein
MWNTAGREPALVGSALSVPRLSPDQPTETALELSVWESEGGRLASPTDAT